MFYRTRAVINKTLKDLSRLVFITYIISQILFIGFAIYKIIANINNLTRLIIYSVSLLLSLFGFIFYLITYSSRKKKNVKKAKLVVRFSKYVVNLATIIVSIIEFVMFDSSNMNLLLLALSIVLLLTQLLIELVRYLYEKYSLLLVGALKLDAEPYLNTINKIAHPKQAFNEYVENKLFKKAQEYDKTLEEEKIEGEDYINSLGEEYKATLEEKKLNSSNITKENIKKYKETIKKKKRGRR